MSFLANIVKSDQYVPDGFLSQFEMDRVSLDAYGALQKVTDKQIQMMIGNYVLIKVLVSLVLGNPSSLGVLPDDQQQAKGTQATATGSSNTTLINFRVLASMTYYIVMEFMEQLFGSKGYMEDLYSTSGLSSIIYKQKELKHLYLGKDNFFYRAELFDIIQVWLSLMLSYIKKEQTKPPPEPIKGLRPASARGKTPMSSSGAANRKK